MKQDRRQDILTAAMQLFAKKGFRGTTTRDLAYQAGVNEAIIFRHFNNKEMLYRAILQHKAGEDAERRCEELEKLAAGNDDVRFFETIGRTFLERHEQDSSFMRLLLFSALEEHELSEMFVTIMTVRNPLANYIRRRIEDGAFRPMNPELAARAFFGMFASFVLWQEIFGLKKTHPHDRDEVVRTFVSIFLAGVKRNYEQTA
jgi:AcrR family transcriptional regulator